MSASEKGTRPIAVNGSTPNALLRVTDRGLYCDAGDFYIDPWLPVDRALITHAHGDHARWGSKSYAGARDGRHVLQTRLGESARIETFEYGEQFSMNGVRLSFHPAGHIIGSAQIRVEHRGEVWAVSGDYKTEPDPTCRPFEPVACNTFVTESTFGLPIYRWDPQAETFADIASWWRANAEAGRASIIFAYALGKAQRVLAGLSKDPQGSFYTHGAVERLNRDYRESGIDLPATTYVASVPRGHDWGGALVIAPPSASGSTWMRRFGAASTAFASGWMRVRGARRRRSVDRGFVVSDHVDWPALIAAIDATGAERVLVTHGYRDPVVRFLRERGLEADSLASRWEGEGDEDVLPPGEEITE
ncbi:MAG: ligase-associated DNA damage response exonuclease [Gemmatimonadaceae bacterium]|nr:ligase-associated DNA damage response exonuclease [Gemmatimonadaceae bacterium]